MSELLPMEIAKLVLKRLKRAPLHVAIRSLVRWTPLEQPESGYTIIIACMRELPAVVVANLRLINTCRLRQMYELVLVFDCREEDVPQKVHEALADLRDNLTVRVVGYSPTQELVSHCIDWGWVYSWLSWSIGIGTAQTRHVLLHDLDALPLDPDLFDSLFERGLRSGAEFSGIRRYQGNGVTDGMNLVSTVELLLDAQYIRRNFRAFDAFNQLRLVEGRLVDFDTLLWLQRRSSRRHIEPIRESQLMHPSQLICQYTDFLKGRNTVAKASHALALIPYFQHLGGEDTELRQMTEELKEAQKDSVRFLGRDLPIGHLPPAHWAWLEKQIRRVEQVIHGATRPEVEAFLAGFIQRAGEARTVGREAPDAEGVPNR